MTPTIEKSDVISYLVDCQCFDREEAEQMVGEIPYTDFMSPGDIREMEAFLGVNEVRV